MTYDYNQVPEWLRVLVGLLILAAPFSLVGFAAGVAWGRRGWVEAVARSIVVWHGEEKDAVISYRGSAAVVMGKGSAMSVEAPTPCPPGTVKPSPPPPPPRKSLGVELGEIAALIREVKVQVEDLAEDASRENHEGCENHER